MSLRNENAINEPADGSMVIMPQGWNVSTGKVDMSVEDILAVLDGFDHVPMPTAESMMHAIGAAASEMKPDTFDF